MSLIYQVKMLKEQYAAELLALENGWAFCDLFARELRSIVSP